MYKSSPVSLLPVCKVSYHYTIVHPDRLVSMTSNRFSRNGRYGKLDLPDIC
jgi:hypothetical protein